MRERTGNDGGILWTRISRGILVLGIGVFLLLTTTGNLPWAFWLEVASFWPVLLIGLGIRIMFRRSRMPWAILLSPLLILGTMTYVAQAGVSARTGEWIPIRVSRPEQIESWRLSGDLAFDELSVRATALDESLLLNGRTASGERGRPRLRAREDWAQVSLGRHRFRNVTFNFFPESVSGWDVEISDALPLTVDLDSAFSSSELDLSALRLERLSLEGAFNSLELDLGETEREARLTLEGAFNSFDLRVPPEVPVSVIADGFLNLVDRRSDPPTVGRPGYRVYLEGAFNTVTVSSD